MLHPLTVIFDDGNIEPLNIDVIKQFMSKSYICEIVL